MKDNLQVFITSLYLLVIGACMIVLYMVFGDNLISSYNRNSKISVEMQKAAELRNSIAQSKIDYNKIVNGVHVISGLAYDDNFELVRSICTSCHSAKLITQNRATRQGWSDMIDWMQQTQGLIDLGANETSILDYLEEHYAPQDIGRRANVDLEQISWYILEQ